MMVLMYRARYRIPVHKIGLHNRFKRYSYLEIMLNPAGGMPFMYVMSFFKFTYLYLFYCYRLFFRSHQFSLNYRLNMESENHYGFIHILP